MKEEEIYVSETAYNRPAPASMRRVSWGAIIAGLFVTIISQVTLTLLGVAIGAATINPMQESRPAEGLATGAGIWFIATALISLFAGAYVAGRLAGGPRRADGLLHGIVMWSVAEVVMLALVTTSLGALLGGTAGLLGNVVQNQQARGQDPLAGIRQQLDRLSADAQQKLQPTGRESGTPGAPPPPEQQQQQAAQPQPPQVNEQEMREAGQKAASGLSTGALLGFVGMILGLAVAAWGGWAGTASLPRYRETVTVAQATT